MISHQEAIGSSNRIFSGLSPSQKNGMRSPFTFFAFFA